MALIKCPECGEEISEVAKSCPHCGCAGKKLKEQKQALKQQKTMEEWNKLTPSQKRISIIVFIIIIAVIALFVIATYPKEPDHSDGKCDICKKEKYSDVNGEEFCYEHYKFAIDYYLND